MFKTSMESTEPQVNDNIEEVKGPHVVWLHGANQSSLSFNYLRSKLPDWNCTLINYSSMDGFYNNLERIIDNVSHQGPLFVVGHSLGGIYALHLLKHCDVVGGVSISTPYRGSSAADWAKFIVPSYPLFKDVGRKSKPIVEAHGIKISVPWTQIVSTTGTVPYLNGANDGVVTVASMEHRKNDMELLYVNHTHYEVMCSDEVSKIIKSKYQKIQQTINVKEIKEPIA